MGENYILPLTATELALYYKLHSKTTEERKQCGEQRTYLDLKFRLLSTIGKH